MRRPMPGPLNQRTVRPMLGGQVTMARLAKLRAQRTLLEAKFMAHPNHGTALALALVLQQQSTEVMKIVGVDVQSELEKVMGS